MLDPTISDPSESLIFLPFELPIFQSSKLIEFIQFRAREATPRDHPAKSDPSVDPSAEPPWALLAPKSRPTVSSIDFGAPFWPIGQRPKKHHFPEPSKINEVGPNVAFIQGLILFLHPLMSTRSPKWRFQGPLQNPLFSKKGPRRDQGPPKNF